MIEQDRDGKKVLPITPSGTDEEDDLRYEIVLAPAAAENRERLLARAASGQLAQAIFTAAKSEHPDRRVILRRDARVLADSGNEAAR